MVAAIGAVLGGLVDDRVGSKPVIVGSLVAMIAAGLTCWCCPARCAFWVCGLLLCLFIGPTQSSARTLLLRMSSDGKEGVAFGLYTMTGRAVSFVAPGCSRCSSTRSARTGPAWADCCLVMGGGLLGMLMVRAPQRALAADAD